MARNEEKARSMLNRFVAQETEKKMKNRQRRPYLSSDCHDLKEAEKWRQQILGEISRKVTDIQNEGLGDNRLRVLNDEINKLIRENSHWERRIGELGGPNYTKHAPKMTDLEGNICKSRRGYLYFGAAKKLQFSEKSSMLQKKRPRNKDEEDGVEAEKEEKIRVGGKLKEEEDKVEEGRRRRKRGV